MLYVALTLGQSGERMWFPKEEFRQGGIEVRKVMLLAAMLAMVLAAAAPAFAQTAIAGSVQYVDCDQIQAAIGEYQNADAEDFSAVAQELGVSQNQVLACFESVAAGRDINVNTATAAASAQYAKKTATSTSTSTSSSSALPSTGGVSVPSAIALGAGVLLVGGGLLARRIVR